MKVLQQLAHAAMEIVAMVFALIKMTVAVSLAGVTQQVIIVVVLEEERAKVQVGQNQLLEHVATEIVAMVFALLKVIVAVSLAGVVHQLTIVVEFLVGRVVH